MDEVKIEECKYRPNVRIGNWNEELFLQEENIRKFLEKRDNGTLLIQQTRRLFSNLLKELEIEAPCHYIRFGAKIQVIATDLPQCFGYPNGAMALSIVVSEKTIHLSQKISDKSDVTVAPSIKPCARNIFIIKSADKVDRTNETLKYGQDFLLQCVEAEKDPLILYSSPKTHELANVANSPYSFYSHGEINQSVGVCLQQDHCCNFMDCLPPVPSTHCRWRILNVVPDMRIESQGEPVPGNTRVVINNPSSNRNLAVETSWMKTFFGPVCFILFFSIFFNEMFL